jgi:hypothetical protein
LVSARQSELIAEDFLAFWDDSLEAWPLAEPVGGELNKIGQEPGFSGGFAMIQRCATFSCCSFIWPSPWSELPDRADSVPSLPNPSCSAIKLLILNRGRKRAPNLRAADRILAGMCTLFMRPARILHSAIVLRPSTLLHFHHLLIQHKYRILFSPPQKKRPGPKGPSQELIDAVVVMKRRNSNWGCPRIAQQISLAFGVDYRQGHGSANLERSLQTGFRRSGSLMVDVSWPRQG